jgi:DNA-binding NtrC family response regulator
MGVRNGRTAWRLLERRSFALLITDYDIPGMNGLHLAWRTRQYLPDLPIILMSGSAPADLQAEVKALNASFMAKPFSLARFEIEVKTLGL